MNQRIEHITKQVDEYFDDLTIEFSREAWQAKFAELIVRECAEIAYKTSWDDLVHGYGQAVIPLHLHNTIKQHFGVEE